MRAIGGSGVEMSALGYGAWVTGADTATATLNPDQFIRAIQAALDAGMTWIDTAELYAAGRSEELVGRAIAGRRDEVLVATKVAQAGAGSGFRPGQVRRAIEGSLRRLGTDRIDLYQLHWHDSAVPIEETWGAMGALVEEGLARFVGVSNFDRDLVERCLSVGPVDTVQNQFSLLHRGDRDELLGWLADRRIAYLGYAPLAFGLLSAAITDATAFEGWDWRSGREARFERNYYEEHFAPDKIVANLELVGELSKLAGELGLPAGVVALRWALEQPGVTALVTGSLNIEHIRANALAGDARLDEATLARIEVFLMTAARSAHGG
jgi:aryl-alcohol dehydrogenase-like predicted oxidoreductase